MSSKIVKFIGAALLLLSLPPAGCGSPVTKGGAKPGDLCSKDADCGSSMKCVNTICTEVSGNGDCKEKTCGEGETCIDGECIPLTPSTDRDGDGTETAADCNDDDASINPNAPELCDGADNDCDGSTDEDCPACAGGEERMCGTDIGECTVGTQKCEQDRWSACSGTSPAEEQCDGLDDDCDGMTDELCPCGDGDTQDCSLNKAVCLAGTQACEAGVWGACSGALPAPEKCDAEDNDCDGFTDEGFDVGLRCRGKGECGEGVIECFSETATGCSTNPGGSASQAVSELCDGKDNDCNGRTDEDFDIGTECDGTGECGAGAVECAAADKTRCSTDPGGSASSVKREVCNGKDDDCNGTPDDGFDTGKPCRGIGECGAGTVECATESATRCSTDAGGSQSQASPERCDGKDNDCDLSIDEDFDVGLPCDGTGACGWGTAECATESATRCSTDPEGSRSQAVPEVCDGQDNDCDGPADEDDPAVMCPHLSNASAGCVNGGCVIASCETFHHDLDQVVSNGCECMEDDGDRNGYGDDCSNPVELPALLDNDRLAVQAPGNIAPSDDVDWYYFGALDDYNTDVRDQTDNFHAKIVFKQNPDGEFAFDVYQGGCSQLWCTAEQDTAVYYTDFRNGKSGEKPCNASSRPGEGYQTCSDNTQLFFIRVYRAAGGPNCKTYELEVSNGIP